MSFRTTLVFYLVISIALIISLLSITNATMAAITLPHTIIRDKLYSNIFPDD